MYNLELVNFSGSEREYLELYNWCMEKDVYEWFEQRILSYDEIVSKYSSKLSDKEQHLYIIRNCNDDIGLVQVYRYKYDINLRKLDRYKNIYEYDLFIGDKNYLGRGFGKIIINKINNIIYNEYGADAIILRPFKKNIRAIKCYLKCNFKDIYEYVDRDTLGNKESVVVFLGDRYGNSRV